MTVSDNTTLVESLGDLFKNPGKKDLMLQKR